MSSSGGGRRLGCVWLLTSVGPFLFLFPPSRGCISGPKQCVEQPHSRSPSLNLTPEARGPDLLISPRLMTEVLLWG